MLRDNLVGRLGALWPEQHAFPMAYLACTLGVFLTSVSSVIAFCLAGYAIAGAILAANAALTRRVLHPRRLFALLQVTLVVLGLVYFLTHLPDGKFTALAFVTAALMIGAAPHPLRLPRVSHWLVALLLGWVYGSLALGVEGLDHVLAHSKNYVGTFLLFFVTLHVIEFHLDGRKPHWWLLIAVAIVNVATLSLANFVTAAMLVGFVLVYAGWPARIAAWVAVLAILGVSMAGGTVRDNLLVFHVAGSGVVVSDLSMPGWLVPVFGDGAPQTVASEGGAGTSSADGPSAANGAAPAALGKRAQSDADAIADEEARKENRRLVLQAYKHSLSSEEKLLSDVSRLAIWRDYAHSLDTTHVILGSWTMRPEDGVTLHNSTLMLHAKFGILAFGLMAIYAAVFLRHRMVFTSAGILTGIFLIRAQADTMALFGTYFDYAVYGVLPLAALAMVRGREAPASQSPPLTEQDEAVGAAPR